MPQVHGLEIAGFEPTPTGFRVGDLVAERLDDTLAWGLGRIQSPERSPYMERRLAAVAVSVLQTVDQAEHGYSSCTDGRYPLLLRSNRLVPVRPQLVGASMVTGFFMAEALGEDFYDDPTAPIDERLQQTAEHLQRCGIHPCTHEDCGARANFIPIAGNVVRFMSIHRVGEKFMARNRIFLGERYDAGQEFEVFSAYSRRLDDPEKYGYDTYTPDVAWRAVLEVTGDEGIYSLNIDRRGQHGHVEEQIIRLHRSVGNRAINGRLVAELTRGKQVFANNDGEIDRLAQAMGRDDPVLVSLARHAGEMFTNAGHATLGKKLPTYQVSKAA